MPHQKILCGILRVDDNNRNDGDAEINFQPHSVGGDATGVNLYVTGDGAMDPYEEPPCVHVSVTKIANGRDEFEWEVTTSTPTTAQVQVTWDSDHVELHEISYLVVGITD